jgi:7,8-dihydro-6-hydroxymethylpterin-pyrophosphokinase
MDQSRIIDADVRFDEEVITTDKLHVPHPMQNRKFVLLPFLI